MRGSELDGACAKATALGALYDTFHWHPLSLTLHFVIGAHGYSKS